jgi:thioredoxin reductase
MAASVRVKGLARGGRRGGRRRIDVVVAGSGAAGMTAALAAAELGLREATDVGAAARRFVRSAQISTA